MKLRVWGFAIANAMLLMLTVSSVVNAQAFRILDHGGSAAAQANAFTAQADDASALYYNPAGMTQLSGIQMYAGASFLNGGLDYTGPDGTTISGDFDGVVAYPPPSFMYITANLEDLGLTQLRGFTAGVGATSPFGTLTDFPDDGPFSTARTFASLPLIDIKPTLAYKVNDFLSLGLGADIYTFAGFLGEGQTELQSNVPGAGGTLTPAEINGSDTAAGFNVSLMYTPLRNSAGKPIANIGLVYRSQVTLQLDGEFLLAGSRVDGATTTLVLPQVFSGGIGVWPIRNEEKEWKLELDVDVTGWQSIKNLDVRLDSGATFASPRDWSNTTSIMLGTEYKMLQVDRLPDWEVALRGGYGNFTSPVPDQTFDPAVPDADSNLISVGAGFLCKGTGKFLGLFRCSGEGDGAFTRDAIGLDLSYQVFLFEPRTVRGNLNPTVDGRYKSIYHMGTFSFHVDF